MGNGFKNYHRCQKNYQANKCDGISLFRYKEIDFLNHEVEKKISKERGVPTFFSSAEEAQLKERGYLKSLPKIFLSKDKHIVPIDLGVGINPLQGGLKTDLVFTIHRERQNNKNEVLLRLQNNALEKLATGKPLKEIFDTLTKGAEGEVNCAKASILIQDNTGTRLLDGSTPSFSEEVRNAFNGMAIGPLKGSCGSAVYNKELVVAEDISTDPRWGKFADFALANGLHSCSSSPIMGADDSVLGSFALTFTQSKLPVDFELEIIKTSARIAALAIEKNRSEENLKLYAQELQRNNEELKNFTFVVSHDLKEPLRKISLFVDQLLEKNLDQEKRDNFIERIGKASTRMYHLTDDLYNWASIGRMETEFISEDLNEIVQEVTDDLEGSIKETGAKIKIDDLPILEIEKTKIHQLFQNLLSNAMKFHREGTSPEIQITSRCTGDGYCEIDIQDNGIGIDAKYYKKIFEPFSRLNNKNDYLGSGIGLAICEKIIRRHQGEIIVDSSLEIGTKITLRLPSQQTIDE